MRRAEAEAKVLALHGSAVALPLTADSISDTPAVAIGSGSSSNSSSLHPSRRGSQLPPLQIAGRITSISGSLSSKVASLPPLKATQFSNQ
jgi:hypothetical protein